jgi:hypothetical protein
VVIGGLLIVAGMVLASWDSKISSMLPIPEVVAESDGTI